MTHRPWPKGVSEARAEIETRGQSHGVLVGGAPTSETATVGVPLSGEEAELLRALGMAYAELLYAAAELRNAASRGDLGNRALLYNLADSLETAAGRLQDHGAEGALQADNARDGD